MVRSIAVAETASPMRDASTSGVDAADKGADSVTAGVGEIGADSVAAAIGSAVVVGLDDSLTGDSDGADSIGEAGGSP